MVRLSELPAKVSKLATCDHPLRVQTLHLWDSLDSHAESHWITDSYHTWVLLRSKTGKDVFCVHMLSSIRFACNGAVAEMSLSWPNQLVLNKLSAGFIPNLLLVPGQRGCCRACSPVVVAVSEELHTCHSNASGVPSETLPCYLVLAALSPFMPQSF